MPHRHHERPGPAARGALLIVVLAAGAALHVCQSRPAAAAAPEVTRLSDTQLDASALYFVSFDGLVNNSSFAQDAILAYAGYQYAAWYSGNRQVVVARRQLPSGTWQSIRLSHTLSTNDSHNVISLGVSPADGRLHVAMDTHNTAVYYIKSEAGLVTNPGSRTWVANRLGGVQRTLDGVSLGNITYPRFITRPDGWVQLSYRTGGSGNGTMELAEYTGTWRGLGKWSSNTGNFTFNGNTSPNRNLYLHGITYGPDSNRLYATGTWRERNTAVLCNAGGITNHETVYVYSDDHGRTWRNNAGQEVARTGSTLVGLGSPGIIVDPMTVDHALLNQESQAVDSTGQPHVIISYVPGRFTQCVSNFTQQRIQYGRAFHLRRDSGGTWRKFEIPVALNAFGRSQIVLDRDDNAYVVMPYGRIVSASKASGWTDWTVRFDGAGLNAFGEVLVDRQRVAAEGVLSILYQQRSSGTTPSPIRVVDFRLG